MLEQSVIGGILRFPESIAKLGLKPEHFADDFCFRAYSAMMIRVIENQPVTLLDVSRLMGGDDLMNLIDLKSWRDEVPSRAALESWASKVKQGYTTRIVRNILRRELDSKDDGNAIRARIITALSAIEDDGRTYEIGGQEWADEIAENMEEIYRAKMEGNGLIGIPTGNNRMDDILGGFQKSDLILMGARPKMGKTAWMMNAAKAGAEAGFRVGIASAEMPALQLGQRLVSDISDLSSLVFRNGNLTSSGFQSLAQGCSRLAELPIRVFDKPRMTVGDIALQAKAWELNGGLDILFVDYLTRLSPDVPDKQRHREVGKMVSDLKTLARTMNIPIVCLAQLSRGLEERHDKRPVPSDLRDSGEIEQEADVIMFLYREHVYDENADPRSGEILVEANRHGPTGRIHCVFDGEFMRWLPSETHAYGRTTADYRTQE
jgi:replicative DNA helicase